MRDRKPNHNDRGKAYDGTLAERAKKAAGMIAAMCKAGRPPAMAVPAQQGPDEWGEDCYIVHVIQDLAAKCEAMEDEIELWKGNEKLLIAKVQHAIDAFGNDRAALVPATGLGDGSCTCKDPDVPWHDSSCPLASQADEQRGFPPGHPDCVDPLAYLEDFESKPGTIHGPKTCGRPCVECLDGRHHWLPSGHDPDDLPDYLELDKIPNLPTFMEQCAAYFACKHCNAWAEIE